jgi:cytochrome b561
MNMSSSGSLSSDQRYNGLIRALHWLVLLGVIVALLTM